MPSEIKQIIFANTNVKLHNYYFFATQCGNRFGRRWYF